MQIMMEPVGYVFSTEHGPREDYWGGVACEIRLDGKQFSAGALDGLAEFSHVEVFFHLHEVEATSVVTGQRHPRGNPSWPQVGIFAQRAKARPNRIAATICELLSVDALSLWVRGLDALDGSPVLDIKPVFAEFVPDLHCIRQPVWSHEMMAKYFARENG